MNKFCTKCNKEYPATIDFFPVALSCKDNLHPSCKKCHSDYHRNYRQKNPEKIRQLNLKRFHGPQGVELWNKFFNEQSGCCAGCKKHQSVLKRNLSLDHDHETGKYRGLLCNKCNFAAGDGKEHIQVLKNLVNYLETFYETI